MKFCRMLHKGQSSEWILTIGVLLALTLLLYQVKQVIVYQVKTSEASALESEARQIASIIDSIGSVNGYAETTYKMRRDLNYELTIKGKLVKIKNLENNQTAFAYFSHPCVYESNFRNVREIMIKKEDECVEVGEYTPPISCTNKDECDDGYCWGTKRGVYYCHRNCGDVGKYAPNEENCCDELILENGKCSIPPTPCDTKDDCPSGYCWGDEPDKYYCHTGCGTEGKYAPEEEDCCSEWNSTTKECVIPQTYDTVLIVAIKSNMEKVYSDSEIKRLEETIDEWMKSMEADDLKPKFFYLDGDETEDEIGSKLRNPTDVTEIEGILKLLIEKTEAKYLIIIGGFDRFPQVSMGKIALPGVYGYISNQSSDDPYGDVDRDGKYIPDIAVGRIPDPNDGDIDELIKAIETSTRLHKAGGIELKTHIQPVMGCGGFDSSPWNSGVCFCKDVFGDTACGGNCGCIGIGNASGKDFVTILAHGPGASDCDLLLGGCITSGTSTCHGHTSFGPNDMFNLDTRNALWMSMACGGGHLRHKDTLSDSIAMSFLYNGGAIFIGSTDINYGGIGPGLPVPGCDCCIGSLYTEIAKRFKPGIRVGDAYLNGKLEFINYPSKYNCNCYGLITVGYQYHINCLYGDPTIKIKSKW